MKLVSILRIKDEIKYIRRCLDKMSELVDEIVILDNGSTDGTLDVYETYPKVVKVLQTKGFDEGRDKIMLLDEAKKRNPDWIIWTDGDEEFESHIDREILNRYMNSKYNKIQFRMCNFWVSEKLYRIDGKYFAYTLQPQRSMWKNTDDAFFQNVKIHNGDIIGVEKPYYISPYRIKHYGYASEEKTLEKLRKYQIVDTTTGRDYSHLNPNKKTIRIPYIEFKNRRLNRTFLTLNKLTISLFHTGYRGYLFIKKNSS
jgi:glycosyltransferase involved in cell wall biosynthesis